MKAHRAFTLIEVVVALVVSGLVVTLAYAAAQGGIDTGSRLGAHRATSESLVTFRALLSDGLRHAERGLRGGPEVFRLHNAMRADGAARDSLTFETRGVLPPYGTSDVWRMSVALHGDTLRLRAYPIAAHRQGAWLMASVAGVTGFDVRALGRSTLAAWRDVWDEADVAPEAVSLSLRGASGEALGAPLVVRLGLERAP